MILFRCGLILISALVSLASNASSNNFDVTNLVASNSSFGANIVDARLINPWGLVFNSGGDLLVADNDSPWLVTSYEENGLIRAGSIFDVNGALPPGIPTNPTGMERNDSSSFVFNAVPAGPSGPARLLIAAESGTVSAYNKAVDLSTAAIVISNSSAVFKGLALAQDQGKPALYVTNFATSGANNCAVNEYDSQYNFVRSFTDPSISPGTGTFAYCPFGIRTINGLLYVTFAQSNGHDDQSGMGNGFVSVFNPNGTLRTSQLIANGNLNSPWGLARVPGRFGNLNTNALLVGNFGDGKINAYDINTGAFISTLSDGSTPIVIDGLWSIKFDESCQQQETTGGGGNSNRQKLYFTSGPDGESEGLVGVITDQSCNH